MEALALLSRLDGLHGGALLSHAEAHLLSPLLGAAADPPPLWRRALGTWAVLYLGALALYLAYATLDTLVLAALRAARGGDPDFGALVHRRARVGAEVALSVRSLAVMSAMSVPLELGVQLGHSRVYGEVARYGVAYLVASPVVFVVVSDACIYWIHRGLHHPRVYRYVHKPHHSFVHTSAFAAFAFHPLDGFLQGVCYQVLPYVMPFHAAAHVASMAAVLAWTVNIHDRASVGIPGVNGGAHHTVHHTTFRSNYGQYFTLWDRLCGTFRDPFVEVEPLSEKQVYGKAA